MKKKIEVDGVDVVKNVEMKNKSEEMTEQCR